jgi:hypothetical protein
MWDTVYLWLHCVLNGSARSICSCPLQAQVALVYKRYNSLYTIFIEQKYHFVGDLHVKSKQATKMHIISPFSLSFPLETPSKTICKPRDATTLSVPIKYHIQISALTVECSLSLSNPQVPRRRALEKKSM